jgi:hypothetical protein
VRIARPFTRAPRCGEPAGVLRLGHPTAERDSDESSRVRRRARA